MTTKNFLGITVLTPHIQNEGIDGVLDNIINRAHATAVAINTSVVAPSAEGEGTFQPPIDAGSSPRLLERQLWGKEALWVRSGPGHRAKLDFFVGSTYKPRQPNDLTASDGPIIGEFIQEAKARGLKVYIQTSGTAPPGLRDEDIPRLPNGRLPDRMAATGCLASSAVRAYNRAWTQDIFAQYPLLDGIRPDWPEYPCYKLDEAFQDFNPQVAQWANDHGFDFQAIQQGVRAFYDYLHGSLTNDDLTEFATMERGRFATLRLYTQFPGVAEWFRLKAALSTDILRNWREAIHEFGGPDKELSANAFMPPFSYVTGLDFAAGARYCASMSAKLYTMHWSQIIKFWGDALLNANPGLSEELVVRTLVNLLDLADPGQGGTTIDDYGYPEPDEPHPIPTNVQTRKLAHAVAAARGQTEINALVHGYGPLDDFTRRFQLAVDSEADGIWINRYGYLGDEKLDSVGKIFKDGGL